MKKVSIIIVNFNGFQDTIDCIETLKKVNYGNFEIIVVDNGSENDYSKLYENYQDEEIIILNSGSNLGFSGGNNLGISYAITHGTDYILLLNNDTLVEPDFLSNMVSSAEQHNLVTCKIMYAANKDKIWHAGGEFNFKTSRTVAYGINCFDGEEYNKTKKITFATGCCMLIPVEIIRKVGLLNEKYFLYCEDTDYCLRVLKLGFNMIYEPKAKIYHKVNASTNKIVGIQTYYLVRNKFYIIRKYIDSKYKSIAYLSIILETIKRILFGEYDFIAAKQGLRDFCRGVNGKKN